MTQHRVCLVSLGCPKNLVDAEVMLGHLPPDRYQIVTDESQAEIIIVNTCAFIREAKEESVDTILNVADQKSTGRCRLLVVSGCLSQRYQEELADELPEVDLFIGTGDAPRIVELLDQGLTGSGPRKAIGARFQRGSVTVSLVVEAVAGAGDLRIDRARLDAYLAVIRDLQETCGLAPPRADGGAHTG